MIKVRKFSGCNRKQKAMYQVAILKCNIAYQDKKFQEKLISHFPFTFNKKQPTQIIKENCEWSNVIWVRGVRRRFRSWGRRFFGKSIAIVRALAPLCGLMKKRKKDYVKMVRDVYDRTIDKTAGTFAHEASHLLCFTHERNDPEHVGYRDSLPYIIGVVMKEYAVPQYYEQYQKAKQAYFEGDYKEVQRIFDGL